MLDPVSLIVLHTAMMWACAVAFALIRRIETGWGFPWHWPVAFFVMPQVMLIGGYAELIDSDGLRLLGFLAGFAGPAILADGVRAFLRLPGRPRLWIVWFVLFTGAILGFTTLLPSLSGRVLVFQLFTAGIGIYAFAVSRHLPLDDHPLGRRFVATFAAAPILAFAGQLLALALGLDQTLEVKNIAVLVLAATAIGIITAIGCVILVAERFAAQVGREARSDVLTGLATRRVFDRALERAVQRFTETATPVSLILFDIDHFKTINDTHGHDVGDIALREVADCARAAVRPGDVLARLGGDEFAILLPETDLPQATNIARRVLEKLRSLTVTTPGGPLRLSGSFGVAQAIASSDTPQAVVKRADLALYEVKRRGRNDVEAMSLGTLPQPA